MPSPTRTLNLEDVRRYLREHSVEPTRERRVGLEVEWLTVDPTRPGAHVDFGIVEPVGSAAPRPAGTTLTFEPGGQVELSTRPMPDVGSAISAVRADAACLRGTLARHGIALLGAGMDERPVRRVRDLPRYRAMEAFFDADGFAGRRMMCTTAAIQVNLDAGTDEGVQRRWTQAHRIGPTLAAVFANSPRIGGKASGWKSSRMANWWAIDPTRTAPVGNGSDCRDSWATYALGANVMLIRRDADRFVPMEERFSLAEWVEGGHPFGWPTEDDIEYHLTTLFPPVRLRGWLELRVLDALPDRWWPVASAVATALLDDDEASARAERATGSVGDRWIEAFRYGPSHPAIGDAARACFIAALDAFGRMGVDEQTAADASAYYDRYVARGRCPADDMLESERVELADDALAMGTT